MRPILITGATGFVGSYLTNYFAEKGYPVVAMCRQLHKARKKFSRKVASERWDGESGRFLQPLFEPQMVIIHLSGENIAGGLWTAARKRAILESRVKSSRAILSALQERAEPGMMLFQASAVGYYGPDASEGVSESAPAGSGFLAEVCRAWEDATAEVSEMGIPRCVFRLGLVLGPGGGFLKRLEKLFRWYLGGHPGSGGQWVSYIHLADVAGALEHLMNQPELPPLANLVTPHPLPAAEFYRELGNYWGRPSWLHAPEGILKLVGGEMARELLLGSQKALPDVLQKSGYRFRYPDLQSALPACSGKAP
ncbi:MAG: TIGR01777 family oxidoreductase [Calditrichia bacterium]